MISATLVLSVSEVMSKCTRMTPCKMEYSDAMSEWPLTRVVKRSRARLLHWFPKMMDCADGRIPTILNSWAWNKRLQLVLLFNNAGERSAQGCLSWFYPPGMAETGGQLAALSGCCMQQLLCCQSRWKKPAKHRLTLQSDYFSCMLFNNGL